jgi:AcrR family transcriptional regulator
MPRRTGEETRRLLIATGLDMLHERGITVGVSHIRLQEVVKRAGLTTGAAYRLWDDQDQFHQDLSVAAARWRAEPPVARTVAAIEGLVKDGVPLPEVIRVAAAAHIAGFGAPADDGLPTSVTFFTTLALRASAQHREAVREASRERHNESIESFVELYSGLMEAYAMQMRPGFTLHDFAIAIAALGEGFAVQAIEGEAHPTVRLAGASGTTSEWTLFGVAIRALVDALMAPTGEK